MGEDEFAALYLQHRSALVWHLRSHGASPAEAADAVQEAFACALRDDAQIRDQQAWPAWLRTVAFRCYLRALSEPGRSAVPVADVPESLTEHLPESDIDQRAEEELVLTLLARLPMQQRRVFTLHYEGWTTAEIATHLGMRAAAVRQNLARARSTLRESLLQDSMVPGDLA